jgi:hypothetical protein
MQQAANEYKTVFTDASKQVEAEYIDTKTVFTQSAAQEQDVVEPMFIPYEAPPIIDDPVSDDDLSLEPTIISYDIKEGN